VRIDIVPLLETNSHPKLLADPQEVLQARRWIAQYPWYARFYEKKKAEVDRFLERPIYISPLKQAYEYPNYDCVKHNVHLTYDEHSPFEHRCPIDGEVFRGEKYDAAWAGWYHGLLSRRLVWMGIVYQISGEERYAEAVREVLVRFSETYSNYPNRNNILGPARIFFGTLGESLFGTHVALGYDLVYQSPCFAPGDHEKIRERFLLPLAELVTRFDETVSNRQTWYNNAVAAIGFVTNSAELLQWALNGKRGFLYQLTSGLPKSGLWYEGPGYHFFTLEGFLLLAEMARHHGLDLYRLEIAGHSIRKMFDAPLNLLAPDYTFPRIKDSGGGSIFSPEKISKYEVGYARYEDERYGQLLKYAYEVKGLPRELEFFFACRPELPEVQRSLKPTISYNFDGNGLAILRDTVHGDEKFAYLDYGLVGGEHGHPDRLGIGYYAFGQHWIVDPLNQDYFKPNLQTWFRQSIAHNTLVLNQSNQAWANGHLRFFDGASGLKVASGFSTKLYGGVFLRRTVVLLKTYCIDICEVIAEDERLIDYPIHSFGELEIEGVRLEKQPEDFFGKPPGIPGYDQLSEIRKGRTDSGWKAHFRKGEDTGLVVHLLGEPGSQVFAAMSPGVGEDYERRLPMVFCRRVSSQTRFVALLEGYRGSPHVGRFAEVGEHTYEVLHDGERELVHLDPTANCYWRADYDGEKLLRISALRIRQLTLNGQRLLECDFPIERLEVDFPGEGLRVEVSEDFAGMKVYGAPPHSVLINGKRGRFTLIPGGVFLSPPDEEGVKYVGAARLDVFAGLTNAVTLPLVNASSQPAHTEMRLELPPSWRDAVKADVDDWGGVVNLPALHKHSVWKRLQPEALVMSDGWLRQVESRPIALLPQTSVLETLRLDLPNDLQQATYPATLVIGRRSYPLSLRVKEPLSLDYFLANGVRETLRFRLANHTRGACEVRLRIYPGDAWRCSQKEFRVELPPAHQKRLDVPIAHLRYAREHQKSPIEVELRCGQFFRRWRKDFYVGYCFKADQAPALDGSFRNWDTTSPMEIDSEEQVSRLLFGNQPWRGPRDLSAKVYAMYDADYLYVGAEVIDDIVSTDFDPRSQTPSDFDSIEIILDTRVNSEQGHDPPTPGVFRHVAVPGMHRIVFDETTKGDIPVRFRQINGAETFWRWTEQGYNIVVRIPWQSLPRVKPEPGMKIGFDIAINDNDGTRYRTNQMLWAGFNQNQSWLDLSLIGALIFRGEGVT